MADVAARLSVPPPTTQSMRTRDGVRLDANVYRPHGDGPHLVWCVAHGYVVVVQDVRGRGASDGVFNTLEQEALDGADYGRRMSPSASPRTPSIPATDDGPRTARSTKPASSSLGWSPDAALRV
ncbi:MAG: CocE/NonD family hydrolase [Caulobacteraceae bacterium]|nr:CocE/NonD family hydrolase [Caulobacteraceae bacterium]